VNERARRARVFYDRTVDGSELPRNLLTFAECESAVAAERSLYDDEISRVRHTVQNVSATASDLEKLVVVHDKKVSKMASYQ